jgi:hypothetical protein
MSLSEDMAHWGVLKQQIDILEAKIKEEVLTLKQTQKVGRVIASYTIGRGSYDYQHLAYMLEPEDSIIQRNSKQVIDWRQVCEDINATDEQKKLFYTPGNPGVTLKIEKEN